jgi:uncharacterized membrane protein
MHRIWTNRLILVFALAGIGVSGYLTLAHLEAVKLGCGRVRGCEEVARHWSAKGLGIPGLEVVPTALFGALMYFTLLGLAFARAAAQDDPERDRKLAGIQWLIALSAMFVTIWLTYMEAYVIKAWCQWCLVSAGLVLLIFITATAERFVSNTLRGAPNIETQGEPV